jgi:DNA-binding response OmpR family regulator
MRILVVEDEPLLADAVAEWLRGDAHAVDVAYDGGAALERIGIYDYDVVVLDRNLPVVHGDQVCRAIVESDSPVRVLMLTAAGEIDDRVAGLALGADDYLPKPFAFQELAARVVALGRRARPAAPPILQRAGIRLDPHRREVYRNGRYVPLSRKEFAVLASCCAPTAPRSPPSSCSRRRGTSTPTRSPTRCGSRSSSCGASSATHRWC